MDHDREVMWAPWDGPGSEHLRLAEREGGVVADGLIIGVDGGRPCRVRYAVRGDADWRVREVRVEVLGAGRPELVLRADGAGAWQTGDGAPLPALAGCLDVDLSVTPFTNTLPIRRLGLQPGATATLAMAYVALPALRVTAERQRYTCLAADPGGGRYRFEAPDDGFTAELPVDAAGLVLDYPGLFRRVWPVSSLR